MMLRLITVLFMLISASAYATLVINEVKVTCGDSPSCKIQSEKFQSLKDSYRNTTHLRQTLKVMMISGGFKDLRWSLLDGDVKRTLEISYTPKLVIGSVQYKSENSQVKEYVERNTKLRVGSWVEDGMFEEEALRMRQYLSSKGYPNAELKFNEKVRGDELLLGIEVIPGKPQLLEELIVKTESSVVKKFADQKFVDLVGKSFDVQLARAKADELEQELFSYGYYLTTITLTPKKYKDGVAVEALIGPVEQWVFDMVQPPPPATDVKMEFGPLVKDLFKRYRRPVDEGALRVGIQENLAKLGHLHPNIKLELKRYKNTLGDWVNHAKVEIIPGERTRVREVSFPGAVYYSKERLTKLWSEQAHELSQQGFFDDESQKAFSEWLRGQYIRLGYVRAQVPEPRVQFYDEGYSAKLEYTVVEGARVYVDEIKFSGLTEDEAMQSLETLVTKQGGAFNPIQFAEDVKSIADELQKKGWYNAEVINRDSDDIVVYGKDRSSVKINIKVRKGKYLTFNRLLIVGNKTTKNSVVKRKSPFKKGEPLSPDRIRDFETTLNSTGLFNSVKVKPIIHKGDTPFTDVAVEVNERDYGLIEIAPGFRTDIGVKLSGTVSLMNLLGENISTSLTGQVNQRVNHQAFDDRRQKEGKNLLEYNVTSQVNVPDIFNTYSDYGVSLTVQRRRFFSFDADIQRISNTISRDFGSRYSVSLRHQFESINQFDATEDRDNGSFKIGALTPSFTADFRNTRINPTAGAWFNISNEFANPLFFSQKQDDLTINFYKLISRNRFYIPIPRGTIAVSVVAGLQENLEKEYRRDSSGNVVTDSTTGQKLTKGYIPNIKVFRLTGIDIVRGFSDEEINRLPNGKDIGTDPVQNKAYLANFKLEPRYFINDSLMAGVFYDAGRVYKDSVDIGDLRQSVGVTFKIVTPVGTLDLDYGFKLLRKRGPDGNLEAPGRFHVSIGFF